MTGITGTAFSANASQLTAMLMHTNSKIKAVNTQKDHVQTSVSQREGRDLKGGVELYSALFFFLANYCYYSTVHVPHIILTSILTVLTIDITISVGVATYICQTPRFFLDFRGQIFK